jgi:aminoglycoside phosphotransferase (APT) family kinase protein
LFSFLYTGQSNPTFKLSVGGDGSDAFQPQRHYVLRKKPPGKLLPSAHAVEREYRVMKALAGECLLHLHGCQCRRHLFLCDGLCSQ